MCLKLKLLTSQIKYNGADLSYDFGGSIGLIDIKRCYDLNSILSHFWDILVDIDSGDVLNQNLQQTLDLGATAVVDYDVSIYRNDQTNYNNTGFGFHLGSLLNSYVGFHGSNDSGNFSMKTEWRYADGTESIVTDLYDSVLDARTFSNTNKAGFAFNVYGWAGDNKFFAQAASDVSKVDQTSFELKPDGSTWLYKQNALSDKEIGLNNNGAYVKSNLTTYISESIDSTLMPKKWTVDNFTYTSSNGITKDGLNFKLGDPLTEDTTILANGNLFKIEKVGDGLDFILNQSTGRADLISVFNGSTNSVYVSEAGSGFFSVFSPSPSPALLEFKYDSSGFIQRVVNESGSLGIDLVLETKATRGVEVTSNVDTYIDRSYDGTLMPRKYMWSEGPTANRPSNPVPGQRYGDHTLGYEILFTSLINDWCNPSDLTTAV